MLVAMGAAIFMVMSELIAATSSVNGDPGRIAAQIVTGIGFLGAGAIIKEGLSVRGLTTAACLWISAAIGMATGAGFYWLGLSATVAALFCLIILKYLLRLFPSDSYRTVSIISDTSSDNLATIKSVLEKNRIKILYIDTNINYSSKTTEHVISVRIFHRGKTDRFSDSIIAGFEKTELTLQSISWTR